MNFDVGTVVGWAYILFLLLLPITIFFLTGDTFVLWFYGLYAISVAFLPIISYLSSKVYRSNFYAYANGIWGSFNRELTNELKKYEWRGFNKCMEVEKDEKRLGV